MIWGDLLGGPRVASGELCSINKKFPINRLRSRCVWYQLLIDWSWTIHPVLLPFWQAQSTRTRQWVQRLLGKGPRLVVLALFNTLSPFSLTLQGRWGHILFFLRTKTGYRPMICLLLPQWGHFWASVRAFLESMTFARDLKSKLLNLHVLPTYFEIFVIINTMY